jgi:hypothetical protein
MVHVPRVQQCDEHIDVAQRTHASDAIAIAQPFHGLVGDNTTTLAERTEALVGHAAN